MPEVPTQHPGVYSVPIRMRTNHKIIQMEMQQIICILVVFVERKYNVVSETVFFLFNSFVLVDGNQTASHRMN